MAYDIEHYSGRGTRREYATQQRLSDILTLAFQAAGVPAGGYEIQEQGDGGLALLPTGGAGDEPRLLVRLINALAEGLVELNDDLIDEAKIRLRVGLHEGVVHRAAHGYAGTAIIEVCRLRDADATRSALANSTAPLVAVVADGLYRDVLSQGYHGLPASAFVPVDVEVKSYAGRGWLYLPPGQGTGPASQSPGGLPVGDTPPADDGTPLIESFLNSEDIW